MVLVKKLNKLGQTFLFNVLKRSLFILVTFLRILEFLFFLERLFTYIYA